MDVSQISQDFDVVTPSDTGFHNGAGFVFTGGSCSVVTAKGETVVVPAGFAGIVFPQAIVRVNATDTTATSVIVFRG